MRDGLPHERAGRWTWTLALGAVLFAMLALMALLNVIWTVVPDHAERLADLGAGISPPTAFIFFLANWFVRLFPLLVLLALPAGAGIFVLLVMAFRRMPRAQFIKMVGMSAFVVASLETLACTFIVLALYLGS